MITKRLPFYRPGGNYNPNYGGFGGQFGPNGGAYGGGSFGGGPNSFGLFRPAGVGIGGGGIGGGQFGPGGNYGGIRPGGVQFGPNNYNPGGFGPGGGNYGGPQVFNNNRPYNRPGLYEPSFQRPYKCNNLNDPACDGIKGVGGGRPIYSPQNGVLVGPGGPFDVPPGSGNGPYRPNGGYGQDGGNGLYPGAVGQPPRGPYNTNGIYPPQNGGLGGLGGPYGGGGFPYRPVGPFGPYGKSADTPKDDKKSN